MNELKMFKEYIQANRYISIDMMLLKIPMKYIYMQHIALYRIMHKTISPNLETENYTETLPKNDNT